MRPVTNYREYVEQVRKASDLVALVKERFTVTANMIVCPFHPDTRPSLSLNPTKQFFYCFGCKATGDVFAWLERLDGIPFREAVEVLARRANIRSFGGHTRHVQSLLSERQMREAVEWFASYYEQRLTAEAEDYITETRGLPPEFILRFRIGWSDGSATPAFLDAAGPSWAPILQAAGITVERQGQLRDHLRDRVILPGLFQHRAVFLSGRTLVPEVEPKYLNQRGVEAPLYNEEDLNPDVVWVAEGQIDTLSICACHQPAVGCLGGVKARHLQKLQRVKRVFALFDADRAGQESTFRLAEALGDAVRIITLEPGTDPNEFYRTVQEAPRRNQDPVAWALSLTSPTMDPVEDATQLLPLFRILATRPVHQQEVYWEHYVAPRLKLSRAASRRVRASLDEYVRMGEKRR